LTLFVLVPVNIWVAAHDGIRWADRLHFFTWGLPSLYLALWLGAAVLVVWAAKAALRATFGRSGKRTWIRLLTAATGLAVLAGILLEPLVEESRWLEWLVLGLALAFLLLLIIALVTRSLQSEFERLPKELRRSIRESIAALQEGHPEEGLAILEGVPLRRRRQAWYLAQRAACYLYLDRLDDAAEDLAAALRSQPRLLYPRLLFGTVELLRGNIEHAEKIMEELNSHAPRDESAWRLRGLVALEATKSDEAAIMFARARRLKGRNAPAMAGEVLAALESGARPDEVDEKLQEARRIEPMDVTVLVAGARRSLIAGDRGAASRELSRALAVLSERGHHGFRRYYRTLAERWGMDVDPDSRKGDG
jgi:tetratricopeptide (TPR) repeat protein